MADSSSITVSRLTERDTPGAITSIQQAFMTDPYNLWIYPDRAAFSLERNRVSLGIRCRYGIRAGMFYVAKMADDDTVLGTAMWMPPRLAGTKQTWGEWWQDWLLWIRQVGMNLWWGRGGLSVKRYYIWKHHQRLAQAALLADPLGYYFCNIITVLPSAQGRGVGRALFKTVTDMADREGRCCYLESSRADPNIKIYERMGFTLVREMECDDDGVVCRLFCMIRHPQKPAEAESVTALDDEQEEDMQESVK